jgi:hypothetical protein
MASSQEIKIALTDKQGPNAVGDEDTLHRSLLQDTDMILFIRQFRPRAVDQHVKAMYLLADRRV